jgi:hypothetical protein
MPFANSKNWVERTMVNGIPDALNQVFLSHLRTQVTARGKPVIADD